VINTYATAPEDLAHPIIESLLRMLTLLLGGSAYAVAVGLIPIAMGNDGKTYLKQRNSDGLH
jgi:hypothetical protein